MLKKFAALALAGSMFVSGTAFAATAANQGALAPAKPAPVKEAQAYHGSTALLWVVGGGLVLGIAALSLTGNGKGTPSTTTNHTF